MKKIAALIGAGAMLLSVAVPAFAGGHRHHDEGNMNVANVTSEVYALSETGGNTVGNSARVRKADVKGDVEVEGDNTVRTGAADALAVGVVVANTQVGCSTCGRRGGSQSEKNIANVTSGVYADAITGENIVGNSASVSKADIGGHRHGGEVEVEGNNNVTTGAADADAFGVVVVNTQWND